jgi:hypothetical protein
MLTENLKKIIEEFNLKTPNNVGVGYGFKISNGIDTRKESIIFFVPEKKKLSNLFPEEILPNEPITIDNKTYFMDVVEVGEIEVLACNPQCNLWITNPPPNRLYIRPVQGGISLTSKSKLGFVGTLGFVAVDIATQSLVGVTNNHVVIKDAFYTTQRNLGGVIFNEYNLNDNGSLEVDLAYQPGESPLGPPQNIIGQVVRYVPIYLGFTTNNKVDGALISLSGTPILSLTESYKQYGLTGNTTPIPFASTAEIDLLLSTNPILYSSGRTTGVKQAPTCPLRVYSLGTTQPISGYKMQGNIVTAYFSDLIAFVRPENDPSLSSLCLNPIAGGDSGSALIADFSGIWKIVGLNFAGGGNFGFACRIDHVASELGIQAWDGSLKNLVDPTTIQFVTVTGTTNSYMVNCSGQTYYQMGLTITSNQCN